MVPLKLAFEIILCTSNNDFSLQCFPIEDIRKMYVAKENVHPTDIVKKSLAL